MAGQSLMERRVVEWLNPKVIYGDWQENLYPGSGLLYIISDCPRCRAPIALSGPGKFTCYNCCQHLIMKDSKEMPPRNRRPQKR